VGLYWEAITDPMRQVLHLLGQSELVPRFYLAGGTALALQLGHRRSVDLDFFSETDEVGPATHLEVLRALSALGPTVVEQVWGNLLLVLQDDLHVGLFGYGYPLLERTVLAEGVPLASLADIGLMKLDTLATRASRKDFCDLFFIAQRISFRELFDLAPHKYPHVRDFESMVVRYMAYFYRADEEAPLHLHGDVEWETVKAFFRQQAALLGRRWLE